MHKENHTQTQYMSLAQAFDYLNATLFDGTLPSVLVTFQRHANSRGYFAPNMFQGRGDAASELTTAEIALNPDTFAGRSDLEIFSTLAHEMVHLWQDAFGKPAKGGYHNRQWADKMLEIGLQPSDTAAPGGKETGPKVSHYVVDKGRFHAAFDALANRGVRIIWESTPRTEAAKKKVASKTKFTCMNCRQNAWGKPTIKIACVPCDLPMVAEEDESETA